MQIYSYSINISTDRSPYSQGSSNRYGLSINEKDIRADIVDYSQHEEDKFRGIFIQ